MFKREVNKRILNLCVLRFAVLFILLLQMITVPSYAIAYDGAQARAHNDSQLDSFADSDDKYVFESLDETESNDVEKLNESEKRQSNTENPLVSVERRGRIDQVSIEHEDDLFDFLALDNILGINRGGDSEIEHLEKIELDGQILNDGEYYITSKNGMQQIIIDGDKLHANPPKKIDLLITASGPAEYGMASKEQLPTRAVLNDEGVFLKANPSEHELGNRSAGQCEPNGNINTFAKTVNVHRPIYNHNQFGAGELSVTLSGLTPGETINEIIFFQDSNFNITDGARALLFEDEDGRLSKANQDRDNYRTVSNVIARDKGPNDSDQSLVLEFPPVKVGQTNEINVVIPSRNAVGYRLRAQVTKILDFGAYAAPYQESDLATALPKRELSDNEKYGGTKVYISENSDNAQLGQARTTLLVKNKGVKDPKPLAESQWSYNGLAFDEGDNWLYAVSGKAHGQNANCYPAGHLLQIHPETGKVRNLGALRGLEGGDIFNNSIDQSGQEIRDRMQINAGSFHGGYLYVSNSTDTGSKKIYRVTPPSKGNFSDGEPIVERTLYESYSSDYVQLTNHNRYLWGLIGSEAKKRAPRWHPLAKFTSNKILVERINLDSGKTDYFEIPAANAKTKTGKAITNPKEWGKAWSYGNGNLGFAAEGVDKVGMQALRLDIQNADSSDPKFNVLEVTPDFSRPATGDSTSNSTRNGFIKSDLEVKKKQLVGPLNSIDQERVNVLKTQGANTEGYYYWLIDIKNIGSGASSGALIYEELPDVFDLSSIRFTAKGLNRNLSNSPVPVMMNGLYPSANGNVWGLEFTVGELAAGNSLRVYLAAKLQPGMECIPNKVAIFNDDADINESNHNSAADCVQEETKVDFTADMIESNLSTNGSLPKHLTGGKFELVEGKEGEHEFNPSNSRRWKSDLNEKGNTGTYSSDQKLLVGNYYWLVEKQVPHDANSPRNYAPLAEPLLFRVVQDINKNLIVEFYNQTPTPKCVTNNGWGRCSDIADSITVGKSSASIQVSRTPVATQPELPKTGESGIIGIVLLGFFILIWGITIMFRRTIV